MSSKSKKCKDDEIINPKTGRCVKKSGPTGKLLISKKNLEEKAKKDKAKTLNILASIAKGDIVTLNINDEREYLRALREETDYRVLRQHLINFGNKFYKSFSGVKNAPDYSETIKKIVFNYKTVGSLVYIIRQYLNQYSLTLDEFYNKFLKDAELYNELIELKKMFLNIVNAIDINQTYVETEFNNFKDKYVKYANFLDKILNEFDLKYLIKFMKEFLKQSHQTPNEFYKEFVSEPFVQYQINKKLGKLEKPVKVDKPKIQLHKKFEEEKSEKYKKCIAMYSIVPWIPENVVGIYISEVDTDISKYIIKILPPINVDGKDWYKVNKYYYDLQCSDEYEKVQTGDLLIFINKKTKNVINFKVGYELYRSKKNTEIKILVQNEDIFAKEQEYIRKKNRSEDDEISDIKNGPITDDTIDAAYKLLINKYFKTNKHGSTKRIASDKFIMDVLNSINESSVNIEEFAKKLAELCAYMSYEIDNINYGVFKSNIENGLYEPEELCMLPEEVKLPEYFSNKNTDKMQLERIKQNLEKIKAVFVTDFINLLYVYKNPYTTKKFIEKKLVSIDASLPDWRTDCNTYSDPELNNIIIVLNTVIAMGKNTKNIDMLRSKLKQLDYITNPNYSIIIQSMNNETDVDVLIKLAEDFIQTNKLPPKLNIENIHDYSYYIKYDENGITYCFKISDILDRVNNNILTNPHTDNNFSPEFIEKVKLYNKFKNIYDTNKPVIQPEQNINKESLAPGLLNFVKADIERMNNMRENKHTIFKDPQEHLFYYEILDLPTTANYSDVIRSFKIKEKEVQNRLEIVKKEIKTMEYIDSNEKMKKFNKDNTDYKSLIQSCEKDRNDLEVALKKLQEAYEFLGDFLLGKKDNGVIDGQPVLNDDNLIKYLNPISEFGKEEEYPEEELVLSNENYTQEPEEDLGLSNENYTQEPEEERERIFFNIPENLVLDDIKEDTKKINHFDNDYDSVDDDSEDDHSEDDGYSTSSSRSTDSTRSIDSDVSTYSDGDSVKSEHSSGSIDSSSSIIDDKRYDFGKYVKKCEYCSDEINGKGFKSILWDNNAPKNVIFCDTDCIENFDWKKYKCKKHKRKPKK